MAEPRSDTVLCWHCQHIYWDSGSPGYSEYTPGDPPDIHCLKDHWHLRTSWGNMEMEDFRAALESARTCTDFALSAEASAVLSRAGSR